MRELDHVVLGVVWQEGPLSGYDLRQVFARSFTRTWSSSTGSIYPAVRRLIEAGLAEASEPVNNRGAQMLSATEAGKAVTRRWMSDVAAELATPSSDPIRSRFTFIELLNPSERDEAVAAARSITQEALTAASNRYLQITSGTQPGKGHLALSGVIFELRARLEWLDQVSKGPIARDCLR
jgi:DNA-binding PadR family transcriptional regulator